MKRRDFIQRSSLAAAGMSMVGSMPAFSKESADELFKISLAEWSVNSLVFGDRIQKLGWEKFGAMLKNDYDNLMNETPMSNLEFPKFARWLGIEAVEYVNTCFFNKAENKEYMAELKNTCEGEGIKSVLIMCDAEGALGDKDEAQRKQAVENHYKWVNAAAYLGCHSIRVNAQSQGAADEQMKLASDGLRQLCEFADKANINVLVENHGGLSSNGEWLVGVMKMTDHKRVGTLPDFGNFVINGMTGESYDRYKGIGEMMPYAKAVSAKSTEFDKEGNESNIDYFKVMKTVLDAGYRGYVGIEFEGGGMTQPEGICATKRLLERIREEYKDNY